MYSLVSAAVLAQDVLRHPFAARLADVLDRVLALTPEELLAFGPPAGEELRREVLARGIAPARSGPPRAEEIHPEGARTVEVLDTGVLGSLEDLLALLAREEPLLSAPAAAREVALDAVAAVWVGPAADLAVTTALARPFATALPAVGPPLDEVVESCALRDLLDELPRRTAPQWQRTVLAHAAHRGQARWSLAMHGACRAAWESGRLHAVARAQLAAARGLALSRPQAALSPVAMVVSGAVQALALADILDRGTTTALLSDWEAGQ